MSKPIRIDFVSDVVCPWCAIGLGGLEEALRRLGDEVDAEVWIEPFELNPEIGESGENIAEHLVAKYGSTPEQMAQTRAAIHERAAAVGFEMNTTDASRIYNTFHAHRLLYWAGMQGEGRQQVLKRTLFDTYFKEGKDLNNLQVLMFAAARSGLDPNEARTVVTENRYADEVRAAEEGWRRAGLQAVPSVVINRRYLIQGGQPPEVYEEALRKIVAEA